MSEAAQLSALEEHIVGALVSKVYDVPFAELRVTDTQLFELHDPKGRRVARAMVSAMRPNWARVVVTFEGPDRAHYDHPTINRAFQQAMVQRVAPRKRNKQPRIPQTSRPRRQLEL